MRRLFVLASLLGLACAPPKSPPHAPAPHPPKASRTERSPAPVSVEPAPAPSLAKTEPPNQTNEEPRFREPLAPREVTRAVVLLYHQFNHGGRGLSLRARDLDAQLTWLETHHVEIVSTSELIEFLHGERPLPARVAVITIDDGYENVYRNAWPILAEHHARFTLGLPTGMLEHPANAPVMSWSEVQELVKSGLCEIASHGHMHRGIVNLSGRLLEEELELSRDLITERTGKAPVAYFYPLGAFSPSAAQAVKKAGYPAAFRASGAPIAAGSGSTFWLPRMTVFHGETEYTVARYFSAGFLAKVSYVRERDPGRG